MQCTNEFGQSVGASVPNWKLRPLPRSVTLAGRTCQLEPLNIEKHADDLYTAFSHDDGRLWTYMVIGPFPNAEEFRTYAEVIAKSTHLETYVVIDLISRNSVGMLSLMHIDPMHGVIELGRIAFSPLLQRSTLSTEALFLLLAYVFDQLGYRRCEWWSNSVNAPSRKAATRLGFMFEGIFHKCMVIKDRVRDKAWYAIIDDKRPQIEATFQAWLAPENFDDQGRFKNWNKFVMGSSGVVSSLLVESIKLHQFFI